MRAEKQIDYLNTPVYFRLTRIVAFTDVLLSLTDTVITALIFFGNDADTTFKSLYYKLVKQQGGLVLNPKSLLHVQWNQDLTAWAAIFVTTIFNLIWFNCSCYLLYATKKTGPSVANRLKYCRTWLLLSSLLLIVYSIHIFTSGNQVPTALLASLVALVYRVFVVCIVYGLFLHLEETVRPYFSAPDGVYLEGEALKQALRDRRAACSVPLLGKSKTVRTSVHIPHESLGPGPSSSSAYATAAAPPPKLPYPPPARHLPPVPQRRQLPPLPAGFSGDVMMMMMHHPQQQQRFQPAYNNSGRRQPQPPTYSEYLNPTCSSNRGLYQQNLNLAPQPPVRSSQGNARPGGNVPEESLHDYVYLSDKFPNWTFQVRHV